MFLVILAQSAATSRAYAVKYQERFVENNDLVGLSMANLAAGLSSTFVVNGSPTKTEMADEAKSKTQVAMLAMAATVAIVLLFLTKPLQYMPNAVLAAVVFVIGVKLVDIANMREIWRLRRDEFAIAAVTAVVVVGVGVEQGIILAIVLSLLAHVRRHYSPHDAVVTRDEQGGSATATPDAGRASRSRAWSSTASASASSTRTPRGSPRRCSALVDVPEPPRWLVLLADAHRRRRLHRRQDIGRARRSARRAQRRVRPRRGAGRRSRGTRPFRADGEDRRPAHVRHSR